MAPQLAQVLTLRLAQRIQLALLWQLSLRVQRCLRHGQSRSGPQVLLLELEHLAKLDQFANFRSCCRRCWGCVLCDRDHNDRGSDVLCVLAFHLQNLDAPHLENLTLKHHWAGCHCCSSTQLGLARDSLCFQSRCFGEYSHCCDVHRAHHVLCGLHRARVCLLRVGLFLCVLHCACLLGLNQWHQH